MMTAANPGGFAFKDETGGNVLTMMEMRRWT